MTVSEAVTYCSSKGLNRTPKTIRKWALRSHKDAEGADLIVRREDIENGFRWSIERDSLDRKIAQEIDFELRNRNKPDPTSLHLSDPKPKGFGSIFHNETELNRYEPSQTGSALSGSEITEEPPLSDQPDDDLVKALKDQIRRLDEQVDFYKEELRDRRTSTKALAEVIQAFRLNAENQNNRQPKTRRHHDVRDPGGKAVGENEAGAENDDEVY